MTSADIQSTAERVITIETQTAATAASYDDQGGSSREHPNSDDHPFPVQEVTEHVA